MNTDPDADYRNLQLLIKRSVSMAVEPLFVADVPNLAAIFLEALPADRRQTYNCSICKEFINKYGPLVSIDRISGRSTSVLWEARDTQFAIGCFRPAIEAAQAAVEAARVRCLFVASGQVWGSSSSTSPPTAVRPEMTWSHLVARVGLMPVRNIAEAERMQAEVTKLYQGLKQSLDRFSLQMFEQAAQIVQEVSPGYGGQAAGQVRWYLEVRRTVDQFRGEPNHLDNLLWRAVYQDSQRFSRLRGRPAHHLLEDIRAGLPSSEVKARWPR